MSLKFFFRAREGAGGVVCLSFEEIRFDLNRKGSVADKAEAASSRPKIIDFFIIG
jgi:hypothetical protein